MPVAGESRHVTLLSFSVGVSKIHFCGVSFGDQNHEQQYAAVLSECVAGIL